LREPDPLKVGGGGAMRYAVILAGGWGERLWPMSTRSRPKQLLALDGERTLVSRTLDRVAPLVRLDESLAMTSESLREMMIPELPLVPPERIVGEPIGRNTAPAIALAARILALHDPEALLVVLPADHLIGEDSEFRRTLALAIEAAETERALVTIGIRPTRPETEYGYVRIGSPSATGGVLHARSFHEKPDRATAEAFVAAGEYLWNSGMFVWRADRFLEEVERHLPEVASALRAVSARPGERAFLGEVRGYYEAVPSISVDYGVMEKADRVLVVPAGFAWDDVGAWPALSRVWGVDGSGNSSRGDALLLDSDGCVVYSEEGTVAVLGMSDVVVARTGDATLVCPKDRARDVRLIVEELKRRGAGKGDR
jgi:mannose-1-phosphate guanylyltransferase